MRCEGDLTGRQRENNPTVDVDGLYSVQMPNCEKKSRRTVERIPFSCYAIQTKVASIISVNNAF